MTRTTLLALLTAILLGALGLGWFLLLRDPPGTGAGGAATPGSSAVESTALPAGGPLAGGDGESAPGSGSSEAAANVAARSGSEGRTSASSRAFDKAKWVEGRVIFPPRAPLDVPVSVVARGRKFENGEYHTAPVEHDGRFRVAFAPDTAIGSLDIESTLLYLAEPERVRPAKPPENLELRPLLGGRIVGTLAVPAGVALHPKALETLGIQIMLWGQPKGIDSWLSRRADVGALVRTSTEIHYELDGLPPGDSYYLQLFIPGFVEQSRAGLAIVEGRETRIDIALVCGARVDGVVVDEDGQPVAKARVRTNDGGWRGEETDEQGRFELLGVGSGPGTLTVSSDDHLELEHDLGTLSDGQELTGLELQLSRGIEIAGVVLRPDGSPAGGAKVAARADTTQLLLGKGYEYDADVDGESSADGTFRIGGLQGGNYDVFAWIEAGPDETVERPERGESSERSRRAPRLRGEVREVPVGTLDVRLTLDAGHELRGRVSNELGAPVERFTVFALPLEEGFWSLFGGQGLSARFDSEDGRFVLEGVQDGEWTVHASALGFDGSNEVTVTLPGFEGELQLLLPTRGTISGVVYDPAGALLPGAEVEIESGDDGKDKTNSKGEFKLKRVRPGPLTLVARATGFATSAAVPIELAPGASVASCVLQVRIPGRIEGEVLPGMGALAGRSVQLSGSDETAHYDVTETDEQGRFAFADLAPGSYEVSMDADYAVGAPDEMVFEGSAPYAAASIQSLISASSRGGRESIDLSEGETERVIFGAPPEHPIVVHGKVTLAGEAVAALITVSGAHAEGITATTDARGLYELTVDGAGEYSFSVQSPADQSIVVHDAREIGPGPRVELDFVLPAGRVQGRVTSALGDALAGVTVWTWRAGEDPHSGQETMTDDEGLYSIAGLAEGEHCVQAGYEYGWGRDESDAWGTVAVSGVEVADDVSPTVDLILRVAGGVEVLPRQTDGKIAHGWQPRLVDESGLQIRPPNSWYPKPGAIGLSQLAAGTYFVTLYDGDNESDTVEVQVLPEMVTTVEIRVP